MVGMFRFRSFLHHLSHWVANALIPIFILLIGLIADPGHAESGADNGKHLDGYPLKQSFTINPADQPLIMDHLLAWPLLAQSTYPVLDEDPLGKMTNSLKSKKR